MLNTRNVGGQQFPRQETVGNLPDSVVFCFFDHIYPCGSRCPRLSDGQWNKMFTFLVISIVALLYIVTLTVRDISVIEK